MYIVTGVSRGLGKAIVEELLERNEKVIGVGRSHNFDHSNFSFLECDLSHPEKINELDFPVLYGSVTLINNAGILGEIKRLSDQTVFDLDKIMMVNVVSPMCLSQVVYAKVQSKKDFALVNISSGAANRSIPSWAGYCASKAALNMLTETFYLEELEKGNHPTVYAVSPGVIDTDMQVQIRSTEKANFSSVENFQELKKSNSLYSAKEATLRLLDLLKLPFNGQIPQDLRTIETH
ncbi:MAG: SDR family NAD(P)-dependent oxidoreductase [Crocinitomicaceae bacterium]|jgi:benzil reductase ((S)-benzoin forming)